MADDLSSQVADELKRRRKDWPEIAAASGVPESTISKIAYRVTANSRFSAIDSLSRVLGLRERANAGAAPAPREAA